MIVGIMWIVTFYVMLGVAFYEGTKLINEGSDEDVLDD